MDLDRSRTKPSVANFFCGLPRRPDASSFRGAIVTPAINTLAFAARDSGVGRVRVPQTSRRLVARRRSQHRCSVREVTGQRVCTSRCDLQNLFSPRNAQLNQALTLRGADVAPNTHAALSMLHTTRIARTIRVKIGAPLRSSHQQTSAPAC